jgi:hypothetical protein
VNQIDDFFKQQQSRFWLSQSRANNNTVKGLPEAIDDSDNLSRAAEVAYEFSVRRGGPSDFYTKNAPAALRIFDTFCKTTFATLSRAIADMETFHNKGSAYVGLRVR